MTGLFTKLRNLFVAGFFFLLPAFVVLIIVSKAWAGLASVGARMAAVFGLKSVLGLGGSSIFTGILMVGICLLCGLLVRFSFLANFSHRVENMLAKYIPGYDSYKTMAEEKLQNRIRILPYTTALIKQNDCWQPAFVVEHDQTGNYVLFLPEIPETSKGRVVLAGESMVRLVPSVSANQLEASLKKTGKGLLTEFGIAVP